MNSRSRFAFPRHYHSFLPVSSLPSQTQPLPAESKALHWAIKVRVRILCDCIDPSTQLLSLSLWHEPTMHARRVLRGHCAFFGHIHTLHSYRDFLPSSTSTFQQFPKHCIGYRRYVCLMLCGSKPLDSTSRSLYLWLEPVMHARRVRKESTCIPSSVSSILTCISLSSANQQSRTDPPALHWVIRVRVPMLCGCIDPSTRLLSVSAA
jgi:hypothetical protein